MSSRATNRFCVRIRLNGRIFIYRSDTHSVKEDADNARDTSETQSRRKAQPNI